MRAIRVVAIIEAFSVSGPAKNLMRFCRLAREYSEPACEISIATFVRTERRDRLPSNDFVDAIRAEGIPLDVIPERRRFDTSVLAQLREIFRKLAPDIIQTHGVKAHFLARLTRPKQIRWLAYHHGYTAEDLKMRLYNQLNRWTLPAADRVVTVCGPFAGMLAATGVSRDRIRVLPNSIDRAAAVPAESSAALREQWKIPPRSLVALAVGRLSQEKGHRELIEAARFLRDRRRDLPLHVVIVGDGPERQRIGEQIAAVGLREHVTLAGQQRRVLPYYAMADVFVLPSYTEGSPNVLLEAMAAGAPVIASAVGGVPETVEHEHTALLVKPRDPADLAGALERLLTSAELRQELRANALEQVSLRFSPDQYCRNLIRIYADLASPR